MTIVRGGNRLSELHGTYDAPQQFGLFFRILSDHFQIVINRRQRSRYMFERLGFLLFDIGQASIRYKGANSLGTAPQSGFSRSYQSPYLTRLRLHTPLRDPAAGIL